MSKSVWIHIIFGNACSTLGLWVEKIGGSEIFLILIPYLGPLVHSAPVLIQQSISNYTMISSLLTLFTLMRIGWQIGQIKADILTDGETILNMMIDIQDI